MGTAYKQFQRRQLNSRLIKRCKVYHAATKDFTPFNFVKYHTGSYHSKKADPEAGCLCSSLTRSLP